jgi:3-hydroxyacyl-CoA dehydrogenase
MAVSGYRPPVKPKFAVFGEQGIATVSGLLANMYAGKQISDHDLLIAKNIAITMCGGEIERDSVVSEDWVLSLEKANFKQLAVSQKTADRIQHMLEKGKPLRN